MRVLVLGLCACHVASTGGARPIEPAQLDAGWLRATPTPVVRQHLASDGGLAALAMIAGAWGRHWSLDDLSRRLHPTGDGVQLGALRDVARDRGLEAFALHASADDLRTELAAGRPVLLGLARNHDEVAVAMDPRDGAVITIDPATGHWMQRSRHALDVEWSAADHAALVVVGNQSLHGELP